MKKFVEQMQTIKSSLITIRLTKHPGFHPVLQYSSTPFLTPSAQRLKNPHSVRHRWKPVFLYAPYKYSIAIDVVFGAEISRMSLGCINNALSSKYFYHIIPYISMGNPWWGRTVCAPSSVKTAQPCRYTFPMNRYRKAQTEMTSYLHRHDKIC